MLIDVVGVVFGILPLNIFAFVCFMFIHYKLGAWNDKLFGTYVAGQVIVVDVVQSVQFYFFAAVLLEITVCHPHWIELNRVHHLIIQHYHHPQLNFTVPVRPVQLQRAPRGDKRLWGVVGVGEVDRVGVSECCGEKLLDEIELCEDELFVGGDDYAVGRSE